MVAVSEQTSVVRPDVSIVIVSRNQRELLMDALSSAYTASSGLTLEVLMVDNNSADGTPDTVKELFPQVEITLIAENLGFAKANNLSLRKASGRYVLLLNPDTSIQGDAVRTVVEFMEQNPDVGICGPKIILASGKLDAPCKRSFKTPAIYFYKTVGLSARFPHSRRFGRYYLSYLDDDQIAEVDSVMGAFLMIRRETIEDIGFLDERFFMYAEEEDWCFRAKKAGWRVVYNPSALVVHHRAGGTKVHPARITYEWHKSAFLFHRKNLAPSYVFPINLAIYIGIGLSFLLKAIRVSLSRSSTGTRGSVGKKGPLVVSAPNGSITTRVDGKGG